MGLFDLLNGNSNKKLKAFLADPSNKGLNLNAPGGRLNLPPLIYAIGVGAAGSLETAKLLLEHGASVQDTEYSAINSTIKFLYMKAYTHLDGYLSMVSLLVKHGAKINDETISTNR